MEHSRHTGIAARLETALVSIMAAATVALLLALPALMWTGCSSSEKPQATADTGSASIVAVSNGADEGATGAKAQTKVERGAYMVTIGGCNDCHTPMKMGEKGPEPDMTRMLSGHPETLQLPNDPKVEKGWDGMTAATTNTAFHGGWGTSFAMNLTPDSLTGIGTWTEEMFVKTIRTGKHWGVGRPINPPMPWFNYRHLTDEDISAVYAYLRTIPPVVNHVQPYRPPSQTVAAK
jgi:mono/diheme cytochrome c family protein